MLAKIWSNYSGQENKSGSFLTSNTLSYGTQQFPRKWRDAHKNFRADAHSCFIPYSPTGGSTHVHQLVDRTLETFLHWIQLRLLPQGTKHWSGQQHQRAPHTLGFLKDADMQSEPNQKQLCSKAKQPASTGTRWLDRTRRVSLGGWGLDLVQRGTFWGDGDVVLSWTACWLSSWN